MKTDRRGFLRTSTALAAGALVSPRALAAIPGADYPILEATTPMSPPAWALLEREVLDAPTARACEDFFDRYFDDRGYLLVRRALGRRRRPRRRHRELQRLADPARPRRRPTTIRHLYKKAWEGHLRQYTRGQDHATCRSPATACTTRNSRSCSTGCTTARG